MEHNIDLLRNETRKTLALLAHAVGSAVGAKPLLLSLYANWQAASPPGEQASGADELAIGMLMALSSLAIKQHPQDPEMLALYRDLRAGPRH